MRVLDPPEVRGRWRALLGYLVLQGLPFAVGGLALLAVEAASGRALPVGALLLALLGLRQVTAFVVTALYHRSASHAALDFHPALRLPLRLWGWLFTGVGLRTWALVHRWHHATGDGPDAPFSPSRPGGSILRCARETIAAHRAAARDPSPLARFGRDLPDDALERFIQAEERRGFGAFGLRLPLLVGLLTAAVAVVLDLPWGTAVGVALAALPAASGSVAAFAVGVVNGVGHLYGTRNFETRDTSTNVVSADWLGMGEALHNNHHARPGSARFAVAPGEVDPTWWVLRALARVGAVTRLVE